MSKPMEVPQQFINLSQLVGVLGQSIVAAEGLNEKGQQRMYDLFDVVVGGLSSYIDQEFPSTFKSNNILSLVNSPIGVSASFSEDFNPEELIFGPDEEVEMNETDPSEPV